MNLRRLSAVCLFLLLATASCKKEDLSNQAATTAAKETAAKGTNLRYIALGNSITSGYSNGGLYRAGQMVAYPNFIANALQTVGYGTFSTPLFPADQANGSGYLKLAGFNPDGTPSIVPVTDMLAIRGQIEVPGLGTEPLYTKYEGNIDNYGVPGIRIKDVTYDGYGNLNGYYERLLPNTPPNNTISYLDFATSKPFNFFSCWLGANDALGYATSGGAGGELTDKTQFALLYKATILKLTQKGAHGVVATIPNLGSLPYFTTIKVKDLVAGAMKVNPAFNKLYIKALVGGTNKYITRAATDKDLVLLTFNTASLGTWMNGMPGYGLLPQNPLDSKEVLDATELSRTNSYITFYNNVIKFMAANQHLALFDSYDYLTKLQNGIWVNGVYVNSKFITGGIFSLDGIHLTPRGNALAGNQFVNAINDAYQMHLPMVDISTYPGVIN